MKQTMQAVVASVLLAARAAAQGTASPSVVTQYYSICPTASSVTVTISTTTTICPGPNCGGTTTVHYNAQPITTVGPDGRTTVFETFPYTAPCPCDGGVCDAVYTVTRECPCTAPHNPTVVPAGFTMAAVPCNACAKNGGPSTVTVVTPAADGPYAAQTPSMGTPYNGAVAHAAASAYASAGPHGAMASGGSNAAASAGNGYASANADSGAEAESYNDSAQASSDAHADAQVGTDNGAAPAPAPKNTTVTPPIEPWTGSGNRAICVSSLLAAGVLGSMVFLL